MSLLCCYILEKNLLAIHGLRVLQNLLKYLLKGLVIVLYSV